MGSVWALDPSKAPTQYVHDAWGRRDGLPGEAVYDLLQTPDGYLWLRTSAGLTRFDGIRFSSIEVKPSNGPRRESVMAMGRGADGGLLVRTPTETLRYEGGRFSTLLPPSELEGAVRVIFQRRNGQLWIGSDDFIYRSGPQGVTKVRNGTGWVFGFREDRRGRLWIGTSTGLLREEAGGAVSPAGFPGPDATAFEEDEAGLWVGTRLGLYHLGPDGRASEAPGQPQPLAQVNALLRDRSGNLWMGTDASGLWRWSRGRWSAFSVRDGLDDNGILSLLEDREGSLWVGTKSGLERLRDPRLTPITMREGLAHDNVAALLEARDGSIFVFSDGGGLTHLKDGAASLFTTKQGLPSDFGGALFEARDGSIWIGTSRGLGRFKDGVLTAYTRGRLQGKGVSAVSEDDEGLILATQAVVLRLRGDGTVEHTVRGKPTPFTRPGNFVFTIERSAHGGLWFGTSSGLFRSPEPGRFEGPERNGLRFPVTALHDDGRDSIWVAGRTPGLVRLRLQDGRTTRYTTTEGLFDNEIRSVVTDRGGNVWASTPRGIFTVTRSDLDAFAEARIPAVRSVAYDVADGMKTREAAAPEHQPAGWVCRDGRLLFATRKGLVVVDPAKLTRNELVPPVLVEEVRADGQLLPTNGPLEVGPGRTSWEFRYTALSLLVPERVRFRYRLEGYDTDWTDAGGRRTAYYTKLPAGRYRFHVVASNDDGVWNLQGAAVDFKLRPRFHETTWFYAIAGALALVLTGGAHRWRTKRLHARQAELEMLVDQRTRDLNAEVAERTRSEAALRGERAILDAVLDQIPDHVYFKNAQGGFTRINRAQAAWLGLEDPQQALGKTDFDYFGREHAEKAAADEARIMSAGDALAGQEEQETWPDGRVTWVHTTKMPLRDGEGRVVGTMGISRDITGRKQLEEEMGRYRERLEADVAERTAQLSASRQLLESILDASTAVIYIKDRNGRFILVNRRFEDLFHIGRGLVVGQTDHDLFPKERADAFRAFDQQVMAAGRALEAEEVAPQDDGLHTYISIKAPLFDDQGRPYAICGVSTDITERKQGEAALARQHAELEVLLAKEQASRRLAERLRAATQALSASMDPQEVFRLILDELRRVVPCDCASVQELRDGQFVVVGGYGFPNLPATIGLPFDLANEEAPNGEVARRRQPVILDDAPRDYPSFRSGLPAGAGIRSWIGVPLLFGDRLLGMLTVDKREPGFYTDEHARVALAFAAQAAIAMENARLYAAVQSELAERERVEGELRRSERQYADLVNSVEGIVWEADARTFAFSFVSRQAERLLGYPVERWLTEPGFWAEHIHPEDRESAVAYCAAATKERRDHEFEYRMVAADGGPVWLRDLVTVVIEEGEVTTLRGVMVDTTERKKVEEALLEAERRYRTIFENAQEGIFQSTPGGRILIANPALARMLGYESPEALTQGTADIASQLYVDPARRDEFKRTLETSDTVQGFVHEARRRDGTTIWISLGARVVRDARGAPLYYEGTAEDISERRRAAEAEAQLKESLRRSEAMSAMGMLVAGVAHEVRNPLFGISANLDAFEARADTRAEFGRFIGLMRGEVQRLATLMQDLLDYGKPLAIAPSPGTIEGVVAEAGERCAALAQARGIAVSVEMKGLVPILMRRPRLVQVVQNLIQNAIENSPAGGVVAVTAALERDPPRGDQVVLTVSDTGPGFAPSDLPRVFEPFFSRRRGGTGLGLAIVERLVAEHGGTITAANRPEGGATMIVKLPARAPGGDDRA